MQVNQKVDKVFIPESPSRLRANDFNQMRDELQGAIEEGGLTPTADVVQLPDAIKAIALQQAKNYTDDQLANLRLIQIVDALPETGDSKYLYGVPQDEPDAQGQTIIVLYVWTDNGWNAAGAMSTNIDPATLATKDDLASYVKKTGDTMTGGLVIATGPEASPLVINYGGSNDAVNTQGSYSSGNTQQTAARGYYNLRKCSGDDNAVNTAGFFVNSDGAAKFVHKRGGGGKAEADDAYILFDATKIKYGASGTKGSTSITEYDVLTSKDIATADKLGGIKIGQNLLMTADGKLSAVVGGQGNAKNLPLFYHTWSDHLLNDISWLRADTFSWQSGDVYTAAYNELASEIEGISQETETIAGTTIAFRRTAAGYKIVTADQENNVISIYNAVGVAWYYILDRTNRRFKLPRTKFGFTGLRTLPGDYVAGEIDLNLNHYHVFGHNTGNNGGSFVATSDVTSALMPPNVGTRGWNGSGGGGGYNGTHTGEWAGNMVTTYPVAESNFGQLGNIQPPATQMYLYFYVGNYTQTAIEQTAGLNAELFNGKLDTTAFSTQASTNAILPTGMDYVVESYSDANGNWYRKYKSGWLEQGGILLTNTTQAIQTINFLKPFANTNYTFVNNALYVGNFDTAYIVEYTTNQLVLTDRTTTSTKVRYTISRSWIAYGQGA